MKHVALSALESKVIRPGFEKHLTPLLMYRGALSLGRAHRLWNLLISGMEHEATCADITQRLTMNPEYSQLCGPERPVTAMGLCSFASRVTGNPKVAAEAPGLAEYLDWIIPWYKRRGSLERVSEITHRSRNMGVGGWRTFVDDRAAEPMPEEFPSIAEGLSIKQARQLYGRSYFIVRRWFREAEIQPAHGGFLPMPEDFGEFATVEKGVALQDRYGVSYAVIRRWREEAGLYWVKPVRKPQKPATIRHPAPPVLKYPFLIHEGGKQEHDLLRRVNAAVPSYLDPDMRADICQDIIVGILCGDFSEDNLTLPAKEMTRRVQQMFPTKYGPLSLDAVMPGTDNFRLIDTLSTEDSLWNKI